MGLWESCGRSDEFYCFYVFRLTSHLSRFPESKKDSVYKYLQFDEMAEYK